MKSYKQTTEYTCAASALVVILHHFNKDIPLNRETEFYVWQKSANLPVRASSIYGLAVVAKKFGLHPRIVLEEREYDYPDYRFKGYKKKEIDEAKFSSKIYAKEARELNIPIEEKEITVSEVKGLLLNKKIILLRVNAGVFRDTGSTSKYVVVYEEDKNYFVIDPRLGKVPVTEESLSNAMTTLQTKKKRDVRMIIFDEQHSSTPQ